MNFRQEARCPSLAASSASRLPSPSVASMYQEGAAALQDVLGRGFASDVCRPRRRLAIGVPRRPSIEHRALLQLASPLIAHALSRCELLLFSSLLRGRSRCGGFLASPAAYSRAPPNQVDGKGVSSYPHPRRLCIDPRAPLCSIVSVCVCVRAFFCCVCTSFPTFYACAEASPCACLSLFRSRKRASV